MPEDDKECGDYVRSLYVEKVVYARALKFRLIAKFVFNFVTKCHWRFQIPRFQRTFAEIFSQKFPF